ncbi:Hypothetical protein PFCIRM121_06655 [Propionibacterium freudenreichii]|uniref:Uncharacterized protein n=1 Tax=Propionibacterium freudenreichii subsp. shermanii (strain ATCC 9614 / DSM 4902 / CIP 103027 / NCIMB 8099 / CIRM-BIA1) TaxID=754252 RepID=D7GHR2_PROFC|nr:Hypothetical protein PFREUD_01190 [Propionibacterium freudenreichii subsp. shermanii CIRM-BIA1]CEG90975.1 Hypothetical protein PFCIRM121_06655 [Propionibacterium freudenreichii]
MEAGEVSDGISERAVAGMSAGSVEHGRGLLRTGESERFPFKKAPTLLTSTDTPLSPPHDTQASLTKPR